MNPISKTASNFYDSWSTWPRASWKIFHLKHITQISNRMILSVPEKRGPQNRILCGRKIQFTFDSYKLNIRCPLNIKDQGVIDFYKRKISILRAKLYCYTQMHHTLVLCIVCMTDWYSMSECQVKATGGPSHLHLIKL